jgi:hypothetical protein
MKDVSIVSFDPNVSSEGRRKETKIGLKKSWRHLKLTTKNNNTWARGT